MNILSKITVSLLTACSVFVLPVSAQPQQNKLEKINFVMPLRNNMLFTYKITERVKAVQSRNGQIADSTEKITTYFVSQQQTPVKDKKGLYLIRVNVDSMTVDYRGLNQHVVFNTQKRPSNEVVRHPEVFGPSVVVNRDITFTITSYGDIIGVESPELAKVRTQARDTSVPLTPFMRTRLLEALDERRLVCTFLPWRGLLPLGQQMKFKTKFMAQGLTTLDFLPFRDTTRLQLLPGSGSDKPHIHFDAVLHSPLVNKITFGCFDQPVNITSATGRTYGDLFIDEDGVVASGLLSVTGTVIGKIAGDDTKTSILQEVYIDRLAIGQAPTSFE